jgi:hypothetical protein
MRPLLMRSASPSFAGDKLPGTERSSKGLFAFWCPVAQWSASHEPAWVHRKQHRPSYTRMRAVQPVSEGLKMPSRQVVKTNGIAD